MCYKTGNLKTMTGNINTANCTNCEHFSKCFQHLFPDELEFITEKKIQLTYLPGETLFKQGAFAPYVMFVIQGLVKVYLQTGSNKQLNIRLAMEGDYLAFSSVFDENIYNYSAVALKNSTVCMIDKTALRKLFLKNAMFAMHITSRNCRNEAWLLDMLKNITYKQMRGKLASALIYLSSEQFLEQDVFQYLTRKDIADFASITTESSIRFIKEFEKEGILKLDGKNISITNRETLVDIAKNG